MEPSRDFAVEFAPSWRKAARRLSLEQLADLAGRLRQLQAHFGNPHAHAGLGLRKLRGNAYELRLSRDVRALFLWLKPRRFWFVTVGNHETIERFLKSL